MKDLGVSAARDRHGVAPVVLLSILLAGLLLYKTGPALRKIGVARATGTLTQQPYLAQASNQSSASQVGKESFAYVRVIWPALVFGILIAAAARISISPQWLARVAGATGWWGAVSGAAAGTPLMLCSCCAAPVFEGVYVWTRRLDASLALLLAAPTLNPVALALTFILFPGPVAAGRVALTAAALIGIAGISTRISVPMGEIADQIPSHEHQSLPAAYARSVLHVLLRTVPFILVGIPAAILVFHTLSQTPSLTASTSIAMLTAFVVAVLLLPMPTLFEIPLAYGLLLIGAPLGTLVAVLFAGPAVNLPSLLIVGRTAGIKASLLLTAVAGGLAIGTALLFPR